MHVHIYIYSIIHAMPRMHILHLYLYSTYCTVTVTVCTVLYAYAVFSCGRRKFKILICVLVWPLPTGIAWSFATIHVFVVLVCPVSVYTSYTFTEGLRSVFSKSGKRGLDEWEMWTFFKVRVTTKNKEHLNK